MSDYDALKRAGYSSAKAIEIVYDARRGCRSAQYLVDNIAREYGNPNIHELWLENGSYGSPEGVQSYAMQDADDCGDVHSKEY